MHANHAITAYVEMRLSCHRARYAVRLTYPEDYKKKDSDEKCESMHFLALDRTDARQSPGPYKSSVQTTVQISERGLSYFQSLVLTGRIRGGYDAWLPLA
jgi:hypothetical protein